MKRNPPLFFRQQNMQWSCNMVHSHFTLCLRFRDYLKRLSQHHGTAFGWESKGPHHHKVTALGSCVKWPLYRVDNIRTRHVYACIMNHDDTQHLLLSCPGNVSASLHYYSCWHSKILPLFRSCYNYITHLLLSLSPGKSDGMHFTGFETITFRTRLHASTQMLPPNLRLASRFLLNQQHRSARVGKVCTSNSDKVSMQIGKVCTQECLN